MARSWKRKKVLGQVQRLEVAIVLFLESDLAPLFHPLSAFWGTWCLKMSEKHSNYAPVHDIQLGKRKSAVPRSILPGEQIFFFPSWISCTGALFERFSELF